MFHHPAFQSLVLPFLAAALAALLVGRAAGPVGAALGAGLGWLLALAWWPGFGWPVHGAASGLPWAAVWAWAVSCGLVWWRTALASQRRPRPPEALAEPGTLLLACLALAGVVAAGGSLLLAQWAASAAASLWVLGGVLRFWPGAQQPGLGALLLPWRLLALAVAGLWWLSAPQGRALALPALVLLGLALQWPRWPLHRHALRRWWLPLVCLGLAVAWQGAAVPLLNTLDSADLDPYYSPRLP